jgi:hypothetical protein
VTKGYSITSLARASSVVDKVENGWRARNWDMDAVVAEIANSKLPPGAAASDRSARHDGGPSFLTTHRQRSILV